jgi:uncharacterized protein
MMNRKEILIKLEKEKGELRKRGVRKMGLFGSFAKGKQKRNSDIDILVSFEHKDYGDQYFELLFYLKKLLRRKIDLIPEECLRKELNYVKKEAEYVTL